MPRFPASLLLAALLAVPAPAQDECPTAHTVVAGEEGRALDAAILSGTGGKFWGAALVARGDEILLAKGYGAADSKDRPNAPDTLFDVGSVAKQFTAAAVLALEEARKLALADSIAKHLAGVPDDKTAITIRHLLTHTSGLPVSIRFEPGELEDRDAMVARAMAAPLESKPGEAFAYNNVGYFVLAAIVERASEVPFETYLEKRLFAPAEMKDTGFVLDRDLDETRQSARVSRWNGRTIEGTALEYSWNWGNRGATGVVTTARDLLTWHRALLGERVLGEEAKRALYEVERGGYACGWFVETTPRGTAKIHHGGATMGYRSQFSRYVDEGVVVIVLTNEEFDASGLDRRLGSVLFYRDVAELAARIDLSGTSGAASGTFHATTGARWVVETTGDPGKERTLLALEVEGEGGRPLEVRANRASAADLADRIEAALRGGAGGAEGDGMEVSISSRPYAPSGHAGVELPRELHWEVASPSALREPGAGEVEERVFLALCDDTNEVWPVHVRMGRPVARRLLDELRKTISKREE